MRTLSASDIVESDILADENEWQVVDVQFEEVAKVREIMRLLSQIHLGFEMC